MRWTPGRGRRPGAAMARRAAGGARRRRCAPEAARAELLAAGMELVAEHTLGAILGHLRINDLARDAGLTSGAFYHYWDGQDAYRAEVLEALLAGDRPDAGADLFADPAPARTPTRWPASGRRVDRAGTLLADDPDHRLELALWVHDEPAARRHLRRRARQVDAAFASAIGDLLATSGRRADPVGGLGSLATLAVALTDGLRTEALIDAGSSRRGTTTSWTPAAAARPPPARSAARSTGGPSPCPTHRARRRRRPTPRPAPAPGRPRRGRRPGPPDRQRPRPHPGPRRRRPPRT